MCNCSTPIVLLAALASAPLPFPGLKTYSIPQSAGQQVSYDATLTQLLGSAPVQPGDNLQGVEGIDDPKDTVRVLITRLDRTSPLQYLVYFNPGPSEDPVFVIADEKTKKILGSLETDQLVFPGNGFVYTMGRTDKIHTEHRKFSIRDGKLTEVKQPFLFVGLESHATTILALTAKKGGGELIATLPKGDPVYVVLSDGEDLLIKSAFGLLGWFRMTKDHETPDTTPIEGIYFAGD